MNVYTLGSSRNPFVQIASLIVVGLALIVAVLAGAVILAAVFGVAMFAAIAISLRVWWLRRKLRRAQPPPDGTIIEAEYRVVHERDLREHDRRD